MNVWGGCPDDGRPGQAEQSPEHSPEHRRQRYRAHEESSTVGVCFTTNEVERVACFA